METLAVYETGDLAYDVVTEHCRARLGDAAEAVPISLRVTTIFRREDGQWRIVHRHADPITDARPIQSIAQPARAHVLAGLRRVADPPGQPPEPVADHAAVAVVAQ